MTENEAKGWAALAATYQKCVEVATETWDGMIGLASAAQQKQAEQMRDRTYETVGGAIRASEIHVPVFTPRDRLQFLKEVSVTLLIEASKRGLSVTDEADVGPPVVPFGKQKGTPLDKVSGIDLESMISWCREKPDRLQRYADFVIAAEADIQRRIAQTEAVQTQPLDEKPLALVTEDRP